MQPFSENCYILGIRHAVSSKVEGMVKVRQFKRVRNLNLTPTHICNPESGMYVRAEAPGVGEDFF